MNKYEKEARVYPAIVGMIIPIILTTLYVTSFIPDTLDVWKSIIAKIGLFIPVALIYGALAYWVRQLFIDASKQLFQFRLFKEDETEMPTTKLLLWSSAERKSEADIKQIAAKVEADFGIRLLSKDEEIANPSEAKRAIVDAVGKIREVTRKNENLQQYNRKYGFCRNYLGACVYAIGAIIFCSCCKFHSRDAIYKNIDGGFSCSGIVWYYQLCILQVQSLRLRKSNVQCIYNRSRV